MALLELQESKDFNDMIDGELEEHQGHGLPRVRVIVFEEILDLGVDLLEGKYLAILPCYRAQMVLYKPGICLYRRLPRGARRTE